MVRTFFLTWVKKRGFRAAAIRLYRTRRHRHPTARTRGQWNDDGCPRYLRQRLVRASRPALPADLSSTSQTAAAGANSFSRLGGPLRPPIGDYVTLAASSYAAPICRKRTPRGCDGLRY